LVQASAENVLLIPVQALHDLGDGTYSVFVVGSDGQPKMRVVEIGLQDAASVEIKSGLNAGDVVSTGTVQTK
jgi:multidrug efflux pump subunit AcrA (membrane-fusion protein)